MLLKNNKVKSIRQNKVTFVKNFVNLSQDFDFNYVSNLLEENNLNVFQKSNHMPLKAVYQIRQIEKTNNQFLIYYDFFKKLFKYNLNSLDGVDIFLSFVSSLGEAHEEEEDVFIIILKGKTIYKVYENEQKSYVMNEGDLIYIPKKIKHKVLALSPRISLSIGFYGSRIN